MSNRIKIIHILNTLDVGGIERIVLELCNRLDIQKYEVTLVILSNNFLDFKHNVAKHINLILVPLKHRSNSSFDTVSLFIHISKIIKIFKDIKPDIIHTHTFQYTVMPILLAIRIAAKKTSHFHTIHTYGIHYENKSIKDSIKLKVEDWWYNRCKTQIICISPIIKEKTDILFKCNSIPSIVICNGIDIERFSNINNLPHVDQILRIVYTARLENGKSHDALLNAFSILTQKHENLELVLIGDGSLLNKLVQLANDLNISNNVKFLGNRPDVPNILSQCDIGVFPSEYEGFGIAMIEMMAMGLPIVCSDLPIFRSIGLDDSNVLFFPPRDFKLLAKQIERFVLEPNLRNEFSIKSLQISKHFSIESMVATYESVYNNVI